MKQPRVYFVAGLPGSGKTTLWGEARRLSAVLFDDFHYDALFNNPKRFPYARRFVELISMLRGGTPCIVTDCMYVEEHYRQEAEDSVRQLIPGIVVEWWFFQNNPDPCRQNARVGNRGSLDYELRRINSDTGVYTIRAGCREFPVYSPPVDTPAS